MKAKFDFGHLKLEERDVLKNFLALLFSKEVSFLNESSDFSKEKERVVFKINDCYFSLAFDEKINIQDEINIFNIHKSLSLYKFCPSKTSCIKYAKVFVI